MSPEGSDRPCLIGTGECPLARLLYTTSTSGGHFCEGTNIMTRISRVAHSGLAFASLLASSLVLAAPVDPNLYDGLKWRNVGPFHGGRISSVTGVIGQNGVFYVGTPLGDRKSVV